MKSKVMALIGIAAACALAAQAPAAELGEVAGSVVKLYVTNQPWSSKQPWSKEPADRRTCSGFLVGQGILTNAHCVMDETFIQIEVPGLADRIEADRIAVNHQVDLALVRPRQPLPASVHAISFGDLPEQREKVVTIGYSIGGRQVSYTEGVVSRIDVMPYAHSRQSNLLVQTDAAINPGNSGGPVFSDRTGECVGMATQRFSGSIGYFIPVPIIRQFLDDIADGRVDGVPFLGIQVQELENPALREYLGMKDGESGVRISRVAAGPAARVLKADDVLMKIEDKQIFNDGRIPFRGNSRIGLAYEVSTRQIGDRVRLQVLRAGKRRDLDVELSERDYLVIPSMPQYDDPPAHYVIGGLLFRAVEPNYIEKDVPFPIRRYLGVMHGEEADTPDELVVISTIYEAELNKGYDDSQENVRVLRVNGRDVNRLEDVRAGILAARGRYHVIELDNGDTIVLDRDSVRQQEAAIRERYKIQ